MLDMNMRALISVTAREKEPVLADSSDGWHAVIVAKAGGGRKWFNSSYLYVSNSFVTLRESWVRVRAWRPEPLGRKAPSVAAVFR
jgi:hypothetical protein